MERIHTSKDNNLNYEEQQHKEDMLAFSSIILEVLQEEHFNGEDPCGEQMYSGLQTDALQNVAGKINK